MIKTVATVVDAARKGDARAFSRLYALFAPVLHGIVRSYVARADVDDIVQEVFETALKHLRELKDAESFPAWIVTIARRRALNAARKPTGIALAEEHPDSAQSPELSAAGMQALEAIRSLPSAYREALILRLVEGLSGPEIAERTGMTEGSVRVNLYRGMRKLRIALGIDASGVSR